MANLWFYQEGELKFWDNSECPLIGAIYRLVY